MVLPGAREQQLWAFGAHLLARRHRLVQFDLVVGHIDHAHVVLAGFDPEDTDYGHIAALGMRSSDLLRSCLLALSPDDVRDALGEGLGACGTEALELLSPTAALGRATPEDNRAGGGGGGRCRKMIPNRDSVGLPASQ